MSQKSDTLLQMIESIWIDVESLSRTLSNSNPNIAVALARANSVIAQACSAEVVDICFSGEIENRELSMAVIDFIFKAKSYGRSVISDIESGNGFSDSNEKYNELDNLYFGDTLSEAINYRNDHALDFLSSLIN